MTAGPSVLSIVFLCVSDCCFVNRFNLISKMTVYYPTEVASRRILARVRDSISADMDLSALIEISPRSNSVTQTVGEEWYP